MDEKKKNFITERIIGRDLTRGRALKYLALAVLCGVIMGVIAVIVFSIGQKRYLKLPADMASVTGSAAAGGNAEDISGGAGRAGGSAGGSGLTDRGISGSDVPGSDMSGSGAGASGAAGGSGAGAGALAGSGVSGSGTSGAGTGSSGSDVPGSDMAGTGGDSSGAGASGAADGTGTADGTSGTITDRDGNGAAGGSAPAGKGTDPSGSAAGKSGKGTSGGNADETEHLPEEGGAAGDGGAENIDPEAPALSAGYLFAGIPDNAAPSVVLVEMTTTQPTWFDANVETSQEFAGLISMVDETEILIISPAGVVNQDGKLSVLFSDGTRQNAVVKQSSVRDNMAVLAVPTEGLGEDFLGKITPAVFETEEEPAAGDMIFTIGAPLGKVRSYGFGLIGYVAAGEQITDGIVNAYYADAAADYEKGTYMINGQGAVIGIAIDSDSENADDASSDAESKEPLTSRQISRFVSAKSLRGLMDTLQKGETPAYFGIRGSDVSFDMRYNNIPAGMYITNIEKGSPAYNAGLMRGDIITDISSTIIDNAAAYSKRMTKTRAGDQVVVKYQRANASGEYLSLELTMTAKER